MKGPVSKRIKHALLAVLALVIVVAVLAGIKVAQIKSMIAAGESFVMPPEAVTSGKVDETVWQGTTTAVGSTVAVQSVTVASEVPGTVKLINFESGVSVKQGDVLVRLDTSIEEAQLASARADAELARVNLERAKQLRAISANTPAELDAARARSAQASALVQNIAATINKKTIRAPFAGRLGIRQVELGQILSPGAPIVTLQSLDPIYAEFWLPQQALASLEPEQAVRVKSDTFADKTWDGKIHVINSEVDVQTRNVRIQAIVPNSDGQLRPGMFVNVEVISPVTRNVLVIPATSVLHAPYGDSVYVIDESRDKAGKTQLVARQVFVRLGERRGDLVAVDSGLTKGQTVVTTGAFKLHNGASVVLHNELAPNVQAAPVPANT